MPVHDWGKVDAGVFHHFHQAWITELSNALNDGILPPPYYALAEQVARPFGPDVLTLQAQGANGENGNQQGHAGMQSAESVALLEKSPKVRVIQESNVDLYARKADRIAIRHTSDDLVVAFLEVLSPGNKSSQRAIDEFLEKVWSALEQGIHLLLIDLFMPTARDPNGIHGLIWGDAAAAPPPDERLTLVAYNAAPPRRAYVEPTSVGATLIDMPLFLDDAHYVPVPLEATYQNAWRGVPGRWKSRLEASA